MTRMYELRQKEVINVRDGGRYGYVSDLEFDKVHGHIKSVIIPGPGKVFGVFGREQEYKIPWCDIKQIGDEIILVDVETKKILVDIEE